MAQENETALWLEAAQRGDADAFARLFAAAGERLLLFIRMRLGEKLRNKVESTDVLQDTWCEALRSIDRFEPYGRGAFAAWLCRIAENRIRGQADHFAARKRRPPGLEQGGSALSALAASATGPATKAERKERRERLARALEALPPDQAEALLLRYFQGLEQAVIAARLGLSVSAARRLIARATLALGRQLRRRGEDPGSLDQL